jgi:hypothetical protein
MDHGRVFEACGGVEIIAVRKNALIRLKLRYLIQALECADIVWFLSKAVQKLQILEALP